MTKRNSAELRVSYTKNSRTPRIKTGICLHCRHAYSTPLADGDTFGLKCDKDFPLCAEVIATATCEHFEDYRTASHFDDDEFELYEAGPTHLIKKEVVL